MKKRLFYTIAAILLFFGLGAALDFGVQKEHHLRTYVKRIERSLHKKESELNALLADTGFIYRNLRGVDKLPTPQQQADLKRLLGLTEKPWNLDIYRSARTPFPKGEALPKGTPSSGLEGDSLVFWLNNHASLLPDQLAEMREKPDFTGLIHLPNGYFEVVKRELQPGSLTAYGLLPIKNHYPNESEYLRNDFISEDFLIPPDVVLSETATPFTIQTMEGKPIAWLDAAPGSNRDPKDKLFLKFVFLIYVMGFIALGVLINDLARMLVQRYQPWVGAAFMLGSVIGVRWLTIVGGFTERFSAFQTFSKVFTEPILRGVNSLGELLINILLLVWMMVFFNREFQVKELTHPSTAIRFGLSTLNFFAIHMGMLMVCSIFKNIVLDSTIVFDFENVFNLNSQSVLAMLGVILLLLAFFLFSHRMMLAIRKIGLPQNKRFLAMGVSLACVAPVILYHQELYPPLVFFAFAALAYLAIFEVFIELESMSLGWLVGWLMFFAALSTGLLYKYNNDKDERRRIQYAIALADYSDKEAEEGFSQMATLLASDSTYSHWEEMVEYAGKGRVPREEARDVIKSALGTNKYLLHNYDFDLFGFFLTSGEIALTEQTQSLGQLEEDYHRASQTQFSNLKFKEENTADPGYMLRLVLSVEKRPFFIFVLFKRKFSTPSKVYTELLLDKKYKDLDELDLYDYGIYQNDSLVEERNKSYNKQLTDSLPPVGETRAVTNTAKRSELIYHAPDRIVIKIGKDLGGYIKPLSLFSYVFMLLTIAVLFLSVLNYGTNALPGPLNFWRNMKPSLRNQYQFWVIGMILFSFIGIGIVSVLYFQQSSNNYHRERLDRKLQSALANVNYEIKDWHREREHEEEVEEKLIEKVKQKLGFDLQLAEEERQEESGKKFAITKTLTSLIPLISEVHRLDVNIYNLQGNLITSSEEDIFRKGIVSPKMGAYAYQELTHMGFKRSDQNESIGTLDYLAAYVPMKNLEGETIAFMGIPYYARQRELRSDVTDFMSTLLNVYVFLLLIAGGLAMVVANRITGPLVNLGESLRRLRLGYNEPITWSRKDEIGVLVEAYNRAAKQIEENAKLLAQSEREDAWREMAKQVAHEIKNPLTPMKLSIQYLQHAYKSDPGNIAPMLDRVTATLVEQIEAMAQIATEFSNFAKMPKAQNADCSVNDIATKVHGLFANERPDMDIRLHLPAKELIVFADRSYLTRVLNNLFKNAIQAIPDHHQGIIEMKVELQNGEKVLASIADNGTGIPHEIREKVFTPNFSTKNSGTGLGLAICKSIIEGFSGRIWFQTETDKGTTFFVELPLLEVSEG